MKRPKALAGAGLNLEAIDLEAFVRVHDTLNSPDGLAARTRLQALAARGDPPVPFNQWTPDDQSAAVTVARQFELVGLLIEGRLFDPNLFLRSWHHTVAWCWQACVPMVEHQRMQLQQPVSAAVSRNWTPWSPHSQ